MKIELISTDNGFFDFNVTGAGTIHRVTVGEDIKRGDLFNIYYGDGSYTPHRKEGAVWQGKKGIQQGVTDYLEKSIRKSDVFIGESADSDLFYKKVATKHCKCNCTSPTIQNRYGNRMLLAVDLEHPEYGRNSSRHIIWLAQCAICGEELTFGSGIGSFHSHGIEQLKQLAEKVNRAPIDWEKVIIETKYI